MSLSTVFGTITAFALVIISIMHTTSNFAIFWELTGFLIVIGLTFATTFMAYEPRYVIQALKTGVRIIYAPKITRTLLKAEVGRILRWAYTVQKSGIPALESETKKSQVDKLLKFGLDLVISGYTGDEVRGIMRSAIETTFQRNTVPAEILKTMAGAAPTFGMLATVLGLMMMLESMGGDPGSLGPKMAVAMAGTLYGVAAARLVFLPAALKVQQREEIARFRNYLILEGLVSIADRKSPRFIQDKMNGYLDPSIHFNIDKSMREQPGGSRQLQAG